ncbi:hypothetical protein CFC21_009418 [Triticum aestivum]|uniref:non-specific serine/threonine protein kinase n=2 Tax=Triticum aestivum TaxID=4565 RepID=A0A9R1ITG8_WHEAT|nr:hypothetical protein CFC21_009418 [Triticum aestivum]
MATLSDLERMLSDESEGPKALPLSLLFYITKGFSGDLKIGSGGFAVVYKGILGNGLVAVKRLNNSYMIDEEFLQEVKCLIKVKHQNVVRFLGYCADTQGVAETYNGNFVMADVQQRLFCFEYVPNGNLGAYISEASHGLEWRKRYQIIKGICEGLNYLHQNNIVHSDLNPANILLDNNMVPKIADFGVSRCFRDNQSGDILTKVVGTMGYMAPEFFSGKIKLKSDIYSLGVIITEIVTGKRHSEDEDVIEIWRNRLEQVKVCVKLGTECTEFNPGKRPPIQLIIDRLAETKSMDWSIKTAVSLTVEQGENASNELCQSTFKLSRDGSSKSYNDGEHVLPAKRSLTFGPCSG